MSSKEDYVTIELKCPFTMMIAGPTKSGKTTFVDRIVKNSDVLYSKQPGKIFYFYNSEEPKYTSLQEKVEEFIEGVPTMDWLSEKYEKYGKNITVIIDDQALNLTKDVAELFTVGSSRRFANIIYITQNLFGKGKECRDISLNCSYICLYKNPRDVLSAQLFFRQYDPGHSKILLDIYRDATEKPHSYLFIDLHQDTENDMRLLSNIFNENGFTPVVYRY